MGWKNVAFGTDTPSAWRYMGHGLLYLSLASMVHGMFCDFVPNNVFTGVDSRFGFAAWGVLLTAVLVVASVRRGNYDFTLPRVLLLIFVAPIFLALVSWLIVAKSVPWLITISIGDPHVETVVLHTRHSYRRRSCSYRLEGPYLEQTFPSYLCISSAYYQAHPNQDVQVELVGQQTLLGFRIAHIQSTADDIPEVGRSK